jgi:ABC-type multidrug transport system ATPase subunit
VLIVYEHMLILVDRRDRRGQTRLSSHHTRLAIEVDDLAKAYRGGTAAVDACLLPSTRGETFGFLGPNGSGNTRPVWMLVALLRATRGRARVGGVDVERDPHQVRGLIGYAGQSVGVDDDLTAFENLAMAGFLPSSEGVWK